MTGTITRGDGKPLSEGLVTFASKEGFSASVPVDTDGTFALTSQYGKGIPFGIYKLMITPADQMQVLDGDAQQPRQKKKDKEHVPAKYRDFSTSGLQFVAQDAVQVLDLKLAN